MATVFLSSAKPFLLPSLSSPSQSSSPSPLPTPPSIHGQKLNARTQLSLCKAVSDSTPYNPPLILTKRGISLSLTTTLFFSIAGKLGYSSAANAAILEADDDEELLERVKKDRKKRIERQLVINSSNKEKAYLQDLVYKLSKVGQAIENNDLSAAISVLGQNTDADWVKKANLAFTKLSSSPEEQTEVDTFNSSLASLISSVVRKDVEASKLAFVSSASAFEKWTALTGLVGQLKGL